MLSSFNDLLLYFSLYLFPLNVLEEEAGLAGQSSLSNGGLDLDLSTVGRDVLADLAALLHEDDLDRCQTGGSLETGDHVLEKTIELATVRK